MYVTDYVLDRIDRNEFILEFLINQQRLEQLSIGPRTFKITCYSSLSNTRELNRQTHLLCLANYRRIQTLKLMT